MKRVLVLFEQSGVIRDTFNRYGWAAMSVDLMPTMSKRDAPNCWHSKGDVVEVVNRLLGMMSPDDIDLVIAHPPCDYLTTSAAWAFTDGPYHQKVKPGTLTGAARRDARDEALKMVDWLWQLPFKNLAIENPQGVINTMLPHMPKPQYIQPYEYGHNASKRTGLWKRGLPDLVPTHRVQGRLVNGKERFDNQTDSGQNRLSPSDSRAIDRAITYQGIADAMVQQWSEFLGRCEWVPDEGGAL